MYEGLYWLALTALVTGFFWAVYVLNRFAAVGVFESLGNPKPDWPPLADWAQRAKAAHANAIENLMIFAPLVLIAAILPHDSLHAAAAQLAQVYFFGRLAHFVLYTAGVPYARTLAFFAGLYAQVALALAILSQLSA